MTNTAIYNMDASENMRNVVSGFINDKTTHPIAKYKTFITMILLSVIGLVIFLIMNWYSSATTITAPNTHRQIPQSDSESGYFKNKYLKYLFEGESPQDQKESSSVVILKKMLKEGFNSNPNRVNTHVDNMSNATKTNGAYASADVSGAKKSIAEKTKTPCATDCGQYLDLQAKINVLTKMVNEVKDQTDEVKRVTDGVQSVGAQIKNLSNSLSPGGKVKIKL